MYDINNLMTLDYVLKRVDIKLNQENVYQKTIYNNLLFKKDYYLDCLNSSIRRINRKMDKLKDIQNGVDIYKNK